MKMVSIRNLIEALAICLLIQCLPINAGTKSLVRQALNYGKTASTQLYKNHPWLVKAGGAAAACLVAQRGYAAYQNYQTKKQAQIRAKANRKAQAATRAQRQTEELERLTTENRILAEQLRQEQNQKNLNDRLIDAVRNNDLAGTTDALRQGAQVNVKQFDSSALICAVKKGNLAIVQALIAAGANVHATNTENKHALWIAMESEHADMIRPLILTGANPGEVSGQFSIEIAMAALEAVIEYSDRTHAIAQSIPYNKNLMRIIADYAVRKTPANADTQQEEKHNHDAA